MVGLPENPLEILSGFLLFFSVDSEEWVALLEYGREKRRCKILFLLRGD